MRRLAGSKRGAESRRRRRINYQLGVLTDSLGKRTVNRQLARRRERGGSVCLKKSGADSAEQSEQRCLWIPDTATGKGRKEPGGLLRRRRDAAWRVGRLGRLGRVLVRRGAMRGEVLVDEPGK